MASEYGPLVAKLRSVRKWYQSADHGPLENYAPHKAADAIEALEARVRDLEGLLRDCADDLEGEVVARYNGTLNYPSEKRRYERDMAPVLAARAALTQKGKG